MKTRPTPTYERAIPRCFARIATAGILGLILAADPDSIAQEPGNTEGAEEEATIQLDFRGVPLATVLEYLSEAAGFVIVLDAEIQGNVTAFSHQPLTRSEAVDLLNTILVEKDYAAVRNGRILKIVRREDAKTRNLPVQTGNDPLAIPAKDEIVTQIIPVRYTDATRLLEDLQPLLDENATLTANASSNALVLTDTLNNVRRITQIVRALDTSISSISSIRVFPLRYSDATELAEVIDDLFDDIGPAGGGGDRDDRRRFFERMRGRGGDDGAAPSGPSEARQAASRIVAVADERTNSLVVGAPEDYMPMIQQLVIEIDRNVQDITELRVFPLKNADALETATLLTDLFDEDGSGEEQGGPRRFFGGPFGRGGPDRGDRGGSDSNESERMLKQSRVVAVGDPRTNSVIVSASKELMTQIEPMIERLDASTKRNQKVFVYSLEHADPEVVASILRGTFEEQGVNGRGGGTANGTVNSVLGNRARTGASNNATAGGFGQGGGGGQGGLR